MRSIRNRLKPRKTQIEWTMVEEGDENASEDTPTALNQDLSVKISHATRLPSMDSNGFSDPFCFIIVGDRRLKTSVKKKTLNPVWNETFTIPWKELRKTNGEVLLEVIDKDEWTKDDFIGMARFDAYNEVRDIGEEQMTFNLKPYPSKKLHSSSRSVTPEDLGDLTIILSWNQPVSPSFQLGSSPTLVENGNFTVKESNLLPIEGVVNSLPSIVHSSRGSIFEEPAIAALILKISQVELNITPLSFASIVCGKKCIIQCTKERAKRHMNRMLDNLTSARTQRPWRSALSYYRSHRSSSSQTMSSLRSTSSSSTDRFFKSILQEDTSSSDDETSSVVETSESGDDTPPTLTDQEIESESQWYYKAKLLNQTRSSETVNYQCNSGMKMDFSGYVCFVVQLPLADVDVQISMCRKCPLSRREISIPFNCSLFGILEAEDNACVQSDHGSMEVHHKLIPLDRRPHVLNSLQVQDAQSRLFFSSSSESSRSDSSSPFASRRAPMMDAENTVIKKDALLGNLEVFLDWIELENVKSTVQSCFCVLKCAEHWALTASQSIEPTLYWKWLLKLPIYEPATVLSLTVFGEGGRVRQLSRLGKLRVRLSTLHPGKETDCQLAFVSEGVQIGKAKLTLKLDYPSDLGLIKGYLKSEFQDDIYNYSLNTGTAKSIIKKERRKIIVQWLDTSEPRIASTVSSKVLDLEREVFSRKRMGVHIRRIQQCFSFFPAISKKVAAIQSWDNPIESIAVCLGIWIGIFNINTVIIIGILLAFLALSISFSACEGPPSMTDPVLMAPTTDHGSHEEKSHEVSNPYSALKSRYDQIQSILVRIQKILDTIASFSERIHALLTWRDPVATRALTVALLFVLLAIAVLGIQACIAFGLCWALRPPILRDPFPPAPINFFKRLPSRSDQIL